jgi:hypothetical protein
MPAIVRRRWKWWGEHEHLEAGVGATKLIVEACPRCGQASRARIRTGKTTFVCPDGHRHGKVLKFVKGKEKP